jgi:outer membrane cobalamin receptor
MNHQVKKWTGRGGVSCIARRKRSFNTLVIFFLLFAATLLFIGTTSAEAMEMDFNIPAQTLSSALKTFAEDTDLQMLYSSDAVKGIRSNSVNGKHQPKEALNILLGGTGLSFKFTDSNTVVVQKNEGRKGGKLVTQREVEKREAAEEKEEVKRPVEMEEMTVTATKSKMNVREVPASVNVVTSEDIKLMPQADTFYDALRNIPGMYMSTVGGDGWHDMWLRGQRAYVLVNGRDLSQFHGGTGVQGLLIGMGAVDTIEVIKGPQSAVHGSKSISGVVNIITKKGDKDNPYVEMNTLYGTGDEVQGGVSFSGGYDKLSYYINALSSEMDEFETPKGTIPFTDWKRKNLYSRFDYELSDNHKIGLEYTHNESESHMGGIGTFHELKKWWKKLQEYTNETQFGFLNYDGDFTDWFSLHAEIGAGRFDYEAINADNDKPLDFLNKDCSISKMYEDLYFGELRGTFNILSENRLRVTTGVQYKRSVLDWKNWEQHQLVFSIDDEEQYIAPYLQVEYKPIDYALLVAGIRHDKYTYDNASDNDATSPKIGLSIFPFVNTDYDWTTVWASYSEGFRTPRGYELYYPEIGNPDLKPQESESWEIGLKQRISRWANLEFSCFETDYTNEIKMTMVSPGTWKQKNIGESRTEGYELLVEVYPTSFSRLYFAYTDLDRIDEITGEKFYGRPDQIFSYGLSIEDLYGFYFSLSGIQKSDWMYNKTNEHPAEDEILWDAKLLYRWDIKQGVLFEPFVSVENLTDKEYYDGGNLYITEGRAWHIGTSLKINF